MNPRILITGGAGYIGSRLRHLFPDADSVDCELYGNPTPLRNANKPYQSICATDLAPYDVIIHLAAHSSVGKCRNDPDGAVSNNLIGFANFLPLCKGKKLVVSQGSFNG